ncbi:MAG: hypothetical protein WCI64_09825 [Chlorobium sp.]
MKSILQGTDRDCHRKSDALVDLTLPKDSNIFAAKYQLYLPSKEELKRELEEAAGIERQENSLQKTIIPHA